MDKVNREKKNSVSQASRSYKRFNQKKLRKEVTENNFEVLIMKIPNIKKTNFSMDK